MERIMKMKFLYFLTIYSVCNPYTISIDNKTPLLLKANVNWTSGSSSAFINPNSTGNLNSTAADCFISNLSINTYSVPFWNTILSAWYAQYLKSHSNESAQTIYNIFECAGASANGNVSLFSSVFCTCADRYGWDHKQLWNTIKGSFKDESVIAQLAYWMWKNYTGDWTTYWPNQEVCVALGGTFNTSNGSCSF
jgi:hypothetical protein